MTDFPPPPPRPPSLEERLAQRMRSHLIRCASVGELEPDDVERLGREFGLEPFGRKPNPADYDPMRESHWTLPMAISWIACRTADSVRDAWPKYVADCWDWMWHRYRAGPGGPIREGWSLEQRRLPTILVRELADLMRADENQEARMTLKQGRLALWEALREGMVPATGIASLGGVRTEIPPSDWLALEPRDSNSRDEVGTRGAGMAFADLLVPAKAVQHLWGPPKPRQVLPPLMRPDGDGYMPLYCAAQWIASKGGMQDFDPEDGQIWREAYAELLSAIASERVGVVGTRGGQKEPVPGYIFADCEVDYPYDSASLEMMIGTDIYLRSYPYIDERHWRRGFDDSLIARRGDQWTRLMVSKDDIRDRWAFESSYAERSGLPGRPTSRHLILAELERRATVGELSVKLREEAEYLQRYMATEHPGAPPALARSIEQMIRSRFWTLTGSHK